jgi:hypothetical protein
MKTIGVLGGMSWKSSADWYRMANEQVHETLGGYHSAPILLDSLDFAEIEALQESGDWEDAGAILAEHAKRLEAAGAGLIVLCTNTMHIVADRITAAIGVPFLHIGDTTAEAITAAGLSTVGVLGTSFTMEQPFYRETARCAWHHVAGPRRCRSGHRPPDHLRRTGSRHRDRSVTPRLPGGHQAPRRPRGRRDHSRLHRDRTAHRPGGLDGPGLPDDRPSCEGSAGGGGALDPEQLQWTTQRQ